MPGDSGYGVVEMNVWIENCIAGQTRLVSLYAVHFELSQLGLGKYYLTLVEGMVAPAYQGIAPSWKAVFAT